MRLSASEARSQFGKLLKRVAGGQEVVITRHDKPVARIVPEGRRSLDEVRQAVAGLRQLQKEITAHNVGKKPLSWKEVKAMIEEGRR